MKKTRTMKTCRIRILALMLAGSTSMPARAEVIPGRWEKVAALQVKIPIMVETKDGDRIEGHFEDLADTDLMLVTNFSRAMIPKEDIETITTRPEDGIANGTLIGGGIGVGVMIGVVMMSALAVKSDHDFNALGMLMMAGIGFGIGAGLGAATDAATKGEAIVVYRAPGTPWSPKYPDSEGKRQ